MNLSSLVANETTEKNIERRTLNGAYIYLLGWLAIGIGTGFSRSEPVWFYGVAVTFFILGVSRLVFFALSTRIKAHSYELWWFGLQLNILLPSMLFSGLFALSMLVPEFEPLMLYIFMTLFAFISNGTVTYSIERCLYQRYLAANIVIPIVTVPIFVTTMEAKMEAVMLLCYGIYMAFLGRQLNREYVERQAQKQALKELSIKDPLTGIFNRRHFDQHLEQAWHTQLRNERRLTIVIVDIDNFKQVNDQFGHPAGDETIKQVAQVLQNTFQRESDIVARIGGEEFAVTIVNAENDDVVKLVERFRTAVERAPNQCWFQY